MVSPPSGLCTPPQGTCGLADSNRLRSLVQPADHRERELALHGARIRRGFDLAGKRLSYNQAGDRLSTGHTVHKPAVKNTITSQQ
jgi:hypothetical protein